MQSLTLTCHARTNLVSSVAVAARPTPHDHARSASSVDPETGSVYCSRGNSTRSTIYRVDNIENVATELASFPSDFADTTGSQHVVGLQYLPESQALCVALEGGDIVLIRTGDDEDALPEVVGSVDAGVLCMEWSPDQELVVVVTGTGTLLEMTKDFEVITEAPIHVAATGEAVQVNVGWGRKETQFHGSEGKEAATRPRPDAASSAVLSTTDDLRPRISWRGDGTLFACSTVDPGGVKRVIRMFDRECVLQSTSEPVPQLEHALCWRPSGNLIASSQTLPHRHDVVFFEKNGLRHGEFALRDPSSTVVELLWNSDSSVLAIWLSFARPEAPASSVVQLWTMANYHWYLKQEIRPPATDDAIAGLSWDPETPLRLHLLTTAGIYQRFEYCMDNFVATGLAHESPSTVAVVDGSSLLLTPFLHCNVPPPMSATVRSLSAPAAHVSFGPGSAGDDFAVLDCIGTLHFYESRSVRKPVAEPHLLGSVILPKGPHETFRQILWITSNTAAGLAYDAKLNRDIVRVVVVDESMNLILESWEVGFDERSPTAFARLVHSPAAGVLFVQATDGQIAILSSVRNSATARFRQELPTVCPFVAAVKVVASDSNPAEHAFIGLSARNKLYAGDRLISAECTSFTIHDSFLILTTFTHTARFIRLIGSVDDIRLSDDSASPFDEHVRRIERGAKIVLAVPGPAALVLQMPRGNLETVYPRALILAGVRRALSANDYKTAFIICRKHRIDLNILVDHDPKAFAANTRAVVEQIAEPDHLNLLISALRDEDVSITMYTGANPVPPPSAQGRPQPGVMPGKVNLICDALRTALHEVDPERYVHSILTTDVKKQPPDLESAMTRIRTLRRTEPDAADAALTYVIFLADVDRLYDTALGMYDFPLTLMVAQHSQKDPREYLPFLSALQKLDPEYQRFRIDDHLEKRARALEHLAAAGSDRHQECFQYVTRHKLYAAAMRVFRSQPDMYKQVLTLHAEDRDAHSYHADAAMLYAMAGACEDAMRSYAKAAMWLETFAIAVEIKLPESETIALARDVAEELVRGLRFADAARVLLDHAKDPKGAVDALTDGGLWSEAARLVQMANVPELTASLIEPKLAQASTKMLETIAEMSADFDKRRDRLQRFRDEKQRAIAAALLAPNDPALDMVDMFSDTTSMATTRFTGASSHTSIGSRSTSYTARTKRGKRKQERKRATGRDKAFEDEYLMGYIRKTLIERSNGMRDEILNLIRALMLHGREDEASAIQLAFKNLIDIMRSELQHIFAVPVQAQESEESVEDYKNRVLAAGGEDVPAPLQARMEPPPVISDAPYGLAFLE
ncbi:hypothetical protein HKX48_000944 [Thoreauomyces humboldtii]|nr:hypothetical protein HKX48_000944 [Thoreauomyces humboldtii]